MILLTILLVIWVLGVAFIGWSVDYVLKNNYDQEVVDMRAWMDTDPIQSRVWIFLIVLFWPVMIPFILLLGRLTAKR